MTPEDEIKIRKLISDAAAQREKAQNDEFKETNDFKQLVGLVYEYGTNAEMNMNLYNIWENPIVVESVLKLVKRGYHKGHPNVGSEMMNIIQKLKNSH